MTRYSKLLSFASAILFLIGTLYYSYIHLGAAYNTMNRLNAHEKSDGTTELKLEFSFSNVNTKAVLSTLLVLAMCAAVVLLIVFAIKNKYHILSAVCSAAILAVQFAVKDYTMVQEVTFARYVLNWGERSFDVGFVMKYIPFAAALLLSAVCFAVVKLAHKSETTCG